MNKNIEFWTNNNIDPKKFHQEILDYLKENEWFNNPDKIGFSGISVSHFSDWKKDKLPAEYMIVLHWTLDGIVGLNIEFSDDEYFNIKKLIEKHKNNFT